MIANPKWFSIRKYGGWGVVPCTWQGWLYITAMILPFIFIKQNSPIFFVWMAFILIDLGDVMVRMKKDERERNHEAMADRNACWIMIALILIDFFYEAIIGQNFDFKLMIILLAGGMAKTVTSWYLRDK